ncbi:MAG: pitrilysin family protein [Candidatus Bathyarchaeia archaeon]|jgi:predicted Zn-dependent peptidase
MSNNFQWERQVLPNGLRVLWLPKPAGLTTQISVAIEYGSNDDPEGSSGTAHFLEHMIVGGSQNRIKLHNEIERLGGCSYFETSEEATFSMVDVFPERIAEASKVLSRLLFDSEFEKDKLELERKVILNEIAENSDDPREKAGETLVKCLFKHHPVKNPVLGLRKSVSQITFDDIEKAHQDHYAPRSMILILTGRFSDRDVEAVLQDYKNRENGNSVSRNNRKIEESKPRKEAVIERSGVTQAYLSFGLRTCSARENDAPNVDLINAILGMGESSRLFKELREKRALTYDFMSMSAFGLDYGYFSINCAVKTKSLEQTQTIIQNELEKLKTSPINKNELEKSKNLILGDIYRSIDTPQELPGILAEMEIYFGNEKALLN